MERRRVLQLLGFGTIMGAIANPVSATASSTTWGYIGADSPEHWGELSPEFHLCQLGQQQTPIDIAKATATESEKLTIDYHSNPTTISNNDRTILVNTESGSFIQFKSESFGLLQFHFHHPGEHQIEAHSFPLEIHFVHRSPSSKLAVVSVLAETGAFNPSLQSIWDTMPTQTGTVEMTNNLKISNLLPRDRAFYEYEGSLSTPPCTEQVLWLVMRQPITVSRQQVQQFAALFPNNARPLQAVGDRVIKQSLRFRSWE